MDDAPPGVGPQQQQGQAQRMQDLRGKRVDCNKQGRDGVRLVIAIETDKGCIPSDGGYRGLVAGGKEIL